MGRGNVICARENRNEPSDLNSEKGVSEVYVYMCVRACEEKLDSYVFVNDRTKFRKKKDLGIGRREKEIVVDVTDNKRLDISRKPAKLIGARR